MSINSILPINSQAMSDAISVNETSSQDGLSAKPQNLLIDSDSKRMLDKATGLLQNIVSEKITDKVIRKIPQDEYLQLLTLLDDMVSGTIDKQV